MHHRRSVFRRTVSTNNFHWRIIEYYRDILADCRRIRRSCYSLFRSLSNICERKQNAYLRWLFTLLFSISSFQRHRRTKSRRSIIEHHWQNAIRSLAPKIDYYSYYMTVIWNGLSQFQNKNMKYVCLPLPTFSKILYKQCRSSHLIDDSVMIIKSSIVTSISFA